MKPELPDRTVTAWARLIRSSQSVLNSVEAVLKSKGLPPLSWYDVLLELHRSGGEGLRPYQIQKQTLLAQYNLSRLIDRMEKEGYVERLRCDADGRGQLIHITKAGRVLLKKMWPVYASAITRYFEQKLNKNEIDALAEILSKIDTSAGR